MRKIIGVLLCIVGIFCSVIFLTIGGITQFVDGLKANPVDSVDVTVGIVRFFLTSLGIWISFGIGALVAMSD